MNTVYFIANFHDATYTGECSDCMYKHTDRRTQLTNLCLYGAGLLVLTPSYSTNQISQIIQLVKSKRVHEIIYSEVTICERPVGFLYPDPGYEGGTGSDSSMLQFAMVVVLWIIIALLLFLFR